VSSSPHRVASRGATTPEENKEVIRRVFDEVVNQGNLDVIDELYSPDIEDHEPVPGAPPGIEGVKYSIGSLREAFPDLIVTIDDMSAHGDMVVVHNTWRGTHLGRLAGVDGTGKQVSFSGIVIWRFEDGKIAERQTVKVQESLLDQIGVKFASSRLFRGRSARTRERVTPFADIQPILPGKLDAWRQFNEELRGPRRREHAESRRRHGVRREMAWYQATDKGDWEILYFEVLDLQRAFEGLATSQDPFDRWFRDKMKELHGVDLERVVATGTPPTELGFEWAGE
jgi:steroid delta-isomerase-like uncharacterized protein